MTQRTEQIRKDATDLLRALLGISLDWVLGSQLGLHFRAFKANREPTTADLKTRFRLASERAMEECWIIQGRQQILPNGATGKILNVSNQVPPATGELSKHSYVKLTESGILLMTATTAIVENTTKAETKTETLLPSGTNPETSKLHFGSIETESLTSASTSSGGSWQEVPVKVVAPRRPTTSRYVSACLFIKNIPSQVNILELVRHLEATANCTVLQARAKQLAHSSPFYFARVVLQTSAQAKNLLGLANNKELELAGRVMTADFDRWPSTNDYAAADSSQCYKRGEPYHTMPCGRKTCAIYIENLPNGTDIHHFVRQIETRYAVIFQHAILADGVKPHDNFWNAHAFMKTTSNALSLLRIGKKSNDKTSQLMYGDRCVWVKPDNNTPDWAALKRANSEHLYCASNYAEVVQK